MTLSNLFWIDPTHHPNQFKYDNTLPVWQYYQCLVVIWGSYHSSYRFLGLYRSFRLQNNKKWSFGLQIIRATDHSSYRSFELQIIQTTDHPDYRLFELQIIQAADHSSYRSFELQIIRATDHSSYRLFELQIIQATDHSDYCSLSNL